MTDFLLTLTFVAVIALFVLPMGFAMLLINVKKRFS